MPHIIGVHRRATAINDIKLDHTTMVGYWHPTYPGGVVPVRDLAYQFDKLPEAKMATNMLTNREDNLYRYEPIKELDTEFGVTYDIGIAEYQRALLLKVLTISLETISMQQILQYEPESPLGESAIEEMQMLRDMLKDMPADEAADPGIFHCLYV